MAGIPTTASNPMSMGSGYKGDVHANNYWTSGNIFSDWLGNQDTFSHNEALAAFQRESTFNAQEAEKARQFEKMMSDTQFQRKVADYLKAGFSPLAALEGNGSYAVSSAPAAAAHARVAQKGSNNFGALLGALMMTIANVVTKGAAGAAANSGNAAKAALDAQKLEILRNQVDVQKGWLDLAKNGHKKPSAIAAEQALRKASHGHSSPKLDWDKILDDLDRI